jgi:hypothetical protein
VQHTLKRETPKAFTTTLFWKRNKGTQVIPVPNGNKVKDEDLILKWAIRSVTS